VRVRSTTETGGRIFIGANNKFLQEKAMETTKQKEEKREKPKPKEQEGMPQRQHCPPAKRRGNRSLKFHEEPQKDVA
jgi:hypothetical protein